MLTKGVDPTRWADAKAKGKAVFTQRSGTEYQVDFYFFGIWWRAWACGTNSVWLLRAIAPEPLHWVPINEGSAGGYRRVTFPENGPVRVMQLAKESIFQLRYFKETAIFHERDTNYRVLVKRVANTPADCAT